MSRYKRPLLLTGLVIFLIALAGLFPSVATAALPLGITLTPTNTESAITNTPSATPESPSATPSATAAPTDTPTATDTPSPTVSTPTGTPVTATAESEQAKGTPKSPLPLLPVTGEDPLVPPGGGSALLALIAILLFSLVGTWIYRTAGARMKK